MKTTIYLPTAEGLNLVTGDSNSWQAHAVLQGTQIQCVAVDTQVQGRVYCGTFGQGVLLSEDGGATWRASADLSREKVTTLFAAAAGPLYAGTEPSAVYRSSDHGESWEPLSSLLSLPSSTTWSFPPRPETNHVQAILGDVNHPGRLHVAIEAGALLFTEDGGTTWRDRLPGAPADTHTLVADPTDSQHLFSAAGDGCFASRDGGKSWHPSMDGLKQTYCWSAAVHPGEPSVVLLSVSEFAFTAHSQSSAQSFVYRKDGDQPWKLSMNGLGALSNARIPVIAAGLREPGSFYLATEAQLYRTMDSGLNWQRLQVEWPRAPIARHSLSMAISQVG